ncbi:2OG-Fe(II) oxygenase [Caulobacter sp. S45]|uniref:prolyl hydroxylase family protein n=1 Tax=Caulobacter sp. S45 TaxID=1641861 RepID=UPI001576A614|nr:2OG-Fe(II) oxygenase [Caulobacter sp. S45]
MLKLADKDAILGAAVKEAEQLLIGREAPHAPQEAIKRLYWAAQEGSVDALLRLAAMTATGRDIATVLPKAAQLLLLAANLGSGFARDQLMLLVDEHHKLQFSSTMNWSDIRDAINIGVWLEKPGIMDLRQDPLIRHVSNVVPSQVCRWLISRAATGLKPALVQVGYEGQPKSDGSRSCSTFMINILNADVIISLVRTRIGQIVETAIERFEPPQILHYGVGEEFSAHYDFLRRKDESDPGGYEGERASTFLLYLNDDYEGGRTIFPKVELSIRAKAGDALWFRNLDGDGRPDKATLHAGTPVEAGEKWVLSQWIHDRRFSAGR